MGDSIKEELMRMAEPEFKKFSSALIPNLDPDTMLGVRLPKLRKMAAQLAKGDWRNYLDTVQDTTFEEKMLRGMVIGCANMELEERMLRISQFVPLIDNWSICDSFCAGLKAAKEHPEEMWEFLWQYFKDSRAYCVRFGIVMLIDYYVVQERAAEVCEILDGITHEDYYVKMAVAWALSVYYVHFPEEVMPYLKKNHLDDFTYNKALQKITESLKISIEEKEKIRRMKRKKDGTSIL